MKNPLSPAQARSGIKLVVLAHIAGTFIRLIQFPL